MPQWLQAYLPARMGEAEIAAAVQAITAAFAAENNRQPAAADMGKIMGAAKAQLANASQTQAQNQANELQKQVQLENPKVSIEETMVAIQKAQVSFQATLHVRNRLVQAYTDIMNMQV